ncbi:MAG: hypothetical protein IJT18_08035 [Oscillospiraceae bacterium]|nr:hypothetical protein [Oscillospiraceae bacterium]
MRCADSVFTAPKKSDRPCNEPALLRCGRQEAKNRAGGNVTAAWFGKVNDIAWAPIWCPRRKEN